MQAVAPVTGSLLVSFEYEPTAGTEWCICHDNAVLAWLVDETGTTPVAPVVLGSMPAVPPDTSPVVSPQWGVREGATWFIPDMARGSVSDLLTFVATNNGAQRQLYANFADPALAAEWAQWAEAHPDLALKTPPNV